MPLREPEIVPRRRAVFMGRVQEVNIGRRKRVLTENQTSHRRLCRFVIGLMALCVALMTGAPSRVCAQDVGSAKQTTPLASGSTDSPDSSPRQFRIVAMVASTDLGALLDITLDPLIPNFDETSIVSIEQTEGEDVWNVTGAWKADYSSSGSGGAWHASIQAFDTGEHPLPEFLVSFRTRNGSIESATAGGDASIEIASVIAQSEDSEQLRDLKPIHTFPGQGFPWLALAGGLLAAGALAFIFWKLAGRGKIGDEDIEPEPELPPGVWAMREIDRRSVLSVNASGPAKEIATLSSDVIRMYLTRRYGFSVLDMTTGECLGVLRDWEPREEIRTAVKRFLEECDFVKFTKFEYTRERWPGLWVSARDIVQASTPSEELDEGANGAGGAIPPKRAESDSVGATSGR